MSVSSASTTLPVIGEPPSLPPWPAIRIFGTTPSCDTVAHAGPTNGRPLIAKDGSAARLPQAQPIGMSPW
ncbi:hypothetical protein LuPra_02619 [Luteitalea pratensis]|uniref:Uncharacterized protein n=1 Tax=Luteitalea pratensis TaxID=1855912 RepID=A0A143PNP1_LUTPR|nr:hypothetical protein [Luteitalea pratensis]AMY09404.1 hypothetical protein LuPra_02619 [Luteitalea pratensis]